MFVVFISLWQEFLRSEWYCRYQIDLLTSRMVTLGDILKHETALSYFTQVSELQIEVIISFAYYPKMLSYSKRVKY